MAIVLANIFYPEERALGFPEEGKMKSLVKDKDYIEIKLQERTQTKGTER